MPPSISTTASPAISVSARRERNAIHDISTPSAITVAAATSPGAFDAVQWVLGSILGRLVLFGYTWALLHHMLGGIRHLIWDTGRGFGPEAREMLARVSLGGSIALTILVWVVAYAVR